MFIMFPEDHHYFDITMLLLLVLVLTIAIVLSKIQNRKLQKMNKNLSDLCQELEEKNKMLEEVATSDKLTGIKNRNYFDQRLYDEMAKMDRYGGDLTLIFFDLDHFKNVNDRYGHDIGDEVLVAIAKHVDGLMRKSDLFARWGGEEFVVLLQNTDVEGAKEAAEKIRKEVEAIKHPGVGQVTVSLGVAQRHLEEDREKWFKRADAALYKAKAEGRNRVCSGESFEDEAMLDIKWLPSYISGHSEIDKQHQMLLQIGSSIINATLKDKPIEVLIEQMDQLIEHVQYHFAYEEEVLFEIGYEGYSKHVIIHGNLIKKAEILRNKLAIGRIDPVEAFDYFVKDIIINHMIREDSKFFNRLKV